VKGGPHPRGPYPEAIMMKKKIAAFCLIACAILMIKSCNFTRDKPLDSIVYIYNINLDSRRTRGTGVVIDTSGYILTAYHVAKSNKEITAHFPVYDEEGKVIPDTGKYKDLCENSACEIIAMDSKRDLALLKFKITPTGLKSIKLARKSAEPAETLIAIGIGSAWHSILGCATKASFLDSDFPDGQKILTRVVETSMSLIPGDSGGPLMNEDGELVGVISSVIIGDKPIVNCIDISEVRAFLAGVKK
jgi:S1-C subfamily serine protease